MDTNPATAFDPFLNFNAHNTKAARARVYVNLHNSGEYELPIGYATINGDLFNLPAGPVSFALGSEYAATVTFRWLRIDSSSLAARRTLLLRFAQYCAGRIGEGVCILIEKPLTRPAPAGESAGSGPPLPGERAQNQVNRALSLGRGGTAQRWVRGSSKVIDIATMAGDLSNKLRTSIVSGSGSERHPPFHEKGMVLQVSPNRRLL